MKKYKDNVNFIMIKLRPATKKVEIHVFYLDKILFSDGIEI